jgi:hypothetical protein
MNIQFVILGWHYNPISYQEGLKALMENNENVNVYFVCKKEPTQYVKDNFKYGIYDNVGLEWKGYTDGFFDLDIDDETVCFFTHDDIEVLDWEFISLVVQALNAEYKLIGNGINPAFMMDPNSIITPNNTDEPFPYGSKYTWKEVAIHKEYFDEVRFCKNLRASFMAMKAKTFRDMKGLEWIKDPYDGKSGNLEWANICCNLNGYKWTKLYGEESIGYLSNTYGISDYIRELERGK